ncbi:hypothetical protein [Streptococcus dentiloxodontae]
MKKRKMANRCQQLSQNAKRYWLTPVSFTFILMIGFSNAFAIHC